MELADIFGRGVMELLEGKFSPGLREYDVSCLPAGIYFCRITKENSGNMKKVINH